jgi:transcriptional regulator
MYIPAHFAEERIEALHEFIREYPLAALISYTPDTGLTASHIPMFLDADSGVLRCHLAKANPQCTAVAQAGSVLVIFGGAEHYVTPSWYPSKSEHGKVVPTWNYTAVHVTGHPRTLDQAELMQLLHNLTDANEADLPERWSVSDAPAEYIAALTNAIIGFEIAIERIEGKWKHSQNRPAADRERVIAGLEALGTPRATEMAAAMKK